MKAGNRRMFGFRGAAVEEQEKIKRILEKEVRRQYRNDDLSQEDEEKYAHMLSGYVTKEMKNWTDEMFHWRYAAFTSQLKALADKGSSEAQDLIKRMFIQYITEKELSVLPSYHDFLKSLIQYIGRYEAVDTRYESVDRPYEIVDGTYAVVYEERGLPAWMFVEDDMKTYVNWCLKRDVRVFPGSFTLWKAERSKLSL